MKIWLTEIQAIDPETGELCRYSGPNIEAASWEEAEEYCKLNGLGYCEVVGELEWSFNLFYN